MFLLVFFFLILFLMFNLSHLLVVLISFEMLSLWVFLSFFLYLGGFTDLFLLLSLMVVTVSESVMGLILFVLFTRFSSKDYVLSLNILKF